MIFCLAASSFSAFGMSLNNQEKIVAGRIIECIKKAGASQETFISVPGTSSVNLERIEEYVDATVGPYFRIHTCRYTTGFETYGKGFYVHAGISRTILEYNPLLKKKAKKIVRQHVKKNRSKKQKVQAICRGVAKTPSYKRCNRRSYTRSMLQNLKRNKGACNAY